jgi:hypothetical protein
MPSPSLPASAGLKLGQPQSATPTVTLGPPAFTPRRTLQREDWSRTTGNTAEEVLE